MSSPSRFAGMAFAGSGQHIAQPSLGIDIVELGSLDQRVDRDSALAALDRTGEGPVATTERNPT